MSDYGSPSPAPAPEPSSAPVKKKRQGVKMTDKQKADLKKHMEKHKSKMTVTEQRKHRMQMMGRMRKGMSLAAAHKDITKSSK